MPSSPMGLSDQVPFRTPPAAVSPGGVTSATHGEAELEDTVKALRNTVRMLKQEGEI